MFCMYLQQLCSWHSMSQGSFLPQLTLSAHWTKDAGTALRWLQPVVAGTHCPAVTAPSMPTHSCSWGSDPVVEEQPFQLWMQAEWGKHFWRWSSSMPSTPDMSHQGWSHLPWPAGDTLPNMSQGSIGLLCRQGTLLACVHPGIHQDPLILLCKAASKPISPWHLLVHGVVSLQVQDLARPPGWNSQVYYQPISPVAGPSGW